jgi:hypothetical protein
VRPPGEGSPGLPGRIAAAIYLGGLSQLHIALEMGKTIEVQLATDGAWNVGDAVTVAFDPQHCYFIAASARSGVVA